MDSPHPNLEYKPVPAAAGAGFQPRRGPGGNWGPPMLLVAVAGAFLLGVYFGRTNASRAVAPPAAVINAEFGKPGDVDASVLWEAWQKVETKYVDRKNIDRQRLLYGAAEGLVRALKDPYSAFLPPPEAKRFEDDVRGAFEGIGAEIGIRKDILTIIAPLEGAPAKAAGLLAGDKILKINDTLAGDLTLEEAVDLIRGPRGTEVTLTIARDGLSETKEIKIRRDVIKIPVLAWETRQVDGKTVAWLRLFHFSDTLRSEFRRAARQIQEKNPQGIVLDLRNNPGGFLEVAADIVGWFLAQDTLVAVEDFGDGRKEEYRTSGPALFSETPLVVLINEGSASASEIVAGALRDQRGIKLVGKKSFGKGSVQELETLRNGASIKITVAKWVTPKGTVLQEEGLKPDIEVERAEDAAARRGAADDEQSEEDAAARRGAADDEQSEEDAAATKDDLKKNRDPQLDKALEILKQL